MFVLEFKQTFSPKISLALYVIKIFQSELISSQ